MSDLGWKEGPMRIGEVLLPGDLLFIRKKRKAKHELINDSVSDYAYWYLAFIKERIVLRANIEKEIKLKFFFCYLEEGTFPQRIKRELDLRTTLSVPMLWEEYKIVRVK